MYDIALRYHRLGWSIVPQRTGEKVPAIRWKPYQTVRPSVGELGDWFVNRYPDAGMAVVLGPVSQLLVIDVDGKEAHEELVRRLGGLPEAPLAMSGSGDPDRFHLYFAHPQLDTRARVTPWHPQLEFRGQGGIVILPPSRHKSGNRYRWRKNRSPLDLAPPPAPKQVLQELVANAHRSAPRGPQRPWRTLSRREQMQVMFIPGISQTTRDFLQGDSTDDPAWNARLFSAAADMAGNRIAIESALPLLLHGAQPWNEAEVQHATATIESAYSEPRISGRDWARHHHPLTVEVNL